MARSSMRSLIKTGFGLGIGLFLSQILFVLLGMLFFIPGLILFRRTSSDKEKDSSSQIGGLVLMGIGVVIMGGAGFGFFIDSLGDIMN
jgi:hypothetical protein